MKATKTHSLYASLLLAFGLGTQAQSVIFTEDFETDGLDVRYTASQPFNDGTSDHWNRTDGSNIANVSGSYTNFSGSFFWAAEDTDDDGGNGQKEQSLDITGIDISGQTDLQFRGLFGAGNANGAGASAYDSLDYIKVQAQIDGGGYFNVIWFSYLDSGDAFNEPLGLDADFDGKADSAGDLLGTALKAYTADIAGTGATLDLRILVYMDAASEEIAFDRLEILEGGLGDIITPALIITESGGGTEVTEGGATDTFTVALATEPTGDVDVIFTPDAQLDLGGGGATAITLTFTSANFDTPQTVTVTAVDDTDEESAHTGTILITTSTTDTDYDAISDSLVVNITDNDAPVVVVTDVWINEFHYDNVGIDVGEFVEVFVGSTYAGPLSAITVTLYNGGDGQAYVSFALDPGLTEVTEGDTIPGVGTFYIITPSSIQNGAPDGIALSDGSGLIEFISYEGTFPAVGGPADGIISVDVGVAQTSSTPIGSSLGLTGAGEVAANFTWSVIMTETPGSINTGQSFGTFVAPPAAAIATATAADTIELSFTTNAATDDVLIVKNLSGSFTDPVGTAPAPGGSFAGGTVVSKGTTSPVNDSGLTPNTKVFYAFFSVDATDNYSAGRFASATPNRIVINKEDFSGTPGWVNQTVSGTDAGWATDRGNAFISGFGDSATENHYLVSPAFDFSTSADLALSFVYSERFNGPDLVILYSTDYTGSGNPEANGSWTEIPFVFDDLSNNATFSGPTAGNVNLPGSLEGVANAYLAFKYTADGTSEGSETWILDDLKLTRSTAAITINPEPTNQVTGFTASASDIDTIDLSWIDASGANPPAGYLILVNQTGTFADPVDGTPVSTDTDLSDGEGAITVFQGTEFASFTGLPGGTEFFFKLFAFSNAGVNIDYKTDGAPTDSATTLANDPEPTEHAGELSVSVDGQKLTLNWIDAGDASGYVIIANTTDSFTAPVDGTDPSVDDVLTDGSALLKVEQGFETAEFIGLPDTEYFFALYAYNNSGINIDFKTDGTVPTASGTTESAAQLIISEIMQNPDAVGDNQGEYIEIYNAGSSPVDLFGYTLKDDGSESHLIASSVIVPAQGYAVLARDGDSTANGGFEADYIYTGFQLGNADDEVVLIAPDGVTEVDRVAYDGGPLWPDPTGAAMVFTGTASDDNNDPAFWTTATLREPGFSGPDGDNGSPGFTGSDQNLPSLSVPFGLSVTSDSPTSASISFTAVGSNDVVILFNSTGSFGTPSGTPPAPGGSIAGGTVLSVGQTSPVAHTGLTTGEEVFYAVFSVNDSGIYSSGLTASVTPGLLNEETFSFASTWVNRTVEGDDPWNTSGGTADIDGATNAGTGTDRHYLVSPEFDLTGKADVTIRFDYGDAYDGPDIQLAYSTNYSGTGNPEELGVTWTIIPTTLIDSDGVDSTPVNDSGLIALPEAIEGEPSVYLAFIYTADGTLLNSEAWQIDNIRVAYSSLLTSSDPLTDYLGDRSLLPADLLTDTNGNGFTVIEEYLAGFGDGVGADRIVFSIDPATGALTLTSDLELDPEGIVIELLATANLSVPFAPVAYSVSSVNNGDGTFTRSYTESTPPAEADNRFYQLRLSVAP